MGVVAFLPIAVDLRGVTDLAEPQLPRQQRGAITAAALSGGFRERDRIISTVSRNDGSG